MYFKQIQEIIDGTKTQTRRVMKPGEEALYKPEKDDPMWRGADGNLYMSHDPEQARKITEVCTASNRLKWAEGRTYAVSPGRGKPGVWALFTGQSAAWLTPTRKLTDLEIKNTLADGWQPLRILLTGIRLERLQDITEADARAEGWPKDADMRECPHCDALYPTGWYDGPQRPCTCNPVTWYKLLWEQINGAGSWDKNPLVWVLEFEVAR